LKERLGIDVSGTALQFYIKDYKEKFDNPFDKTAKLFFTANSYRCEEVKSDLVEIGEDLSITLLDPYGNPLKDVDYAIIGPDGQEKTGRTGSNGKIEEKAIIPGRHQLKIVHKEESEA
jgi:hypothetical protein